MRERKGTVLERVIKWNWEIEEASHLGDALELQSWDGVEGRIWVWVRFWFNEEFMEKISKWYVRQSVEVHMYIREECTDTV